MSTSITTNSLTLEQAESHVIGDCSDGDEDMEPVDEQEVIQKLKEMGNQYFKDKEPEAAYNSWAEGLKLLLKRSVRGIITADHHDLVFVFRLNMAQALLVLEKYVEALDQVEVVLDQRPQNQKALYRKCQALLAMQDYSNCMICAQKALELDSQNSAFRKIYNETLLSKKSESANQKAFYGKMYRPHTDGAHTTSEGNSSSTSLVSSPKSPLRINWEGCGSSDDVTNDLWTNIHTAEDMFGDLKKRPMILSLPFTLLHACDTSSQSSLATDADQHCCKTLLAKEKLTIHLIGARGDVEMGCMWSTLLTKLPICLNLHLIAIGFLETDDPWATKLRYGSLSAPLLSGIGASQSKQMTCQIFKGTYQQFLAINPHTLSEFQHPFHPDLVMVAEPNMSQHFHSWIPVFSDLIDSRVFCVITGHSVEDFDSHEALNLQPILTKLSAHFVMPVTRNPYSIKIRPNPGTPPMPCFVSYDCAPRMYCGPSSKNSVFCTIRGWEGGGGPPALVKTPIDVENLKIQLKNEDIDVDFESILRMRQSDPAVKA